MAHEEDYSRKGPLSRTSPSTRILDAMQQESMEEANRGGTNRAGPVERASAIRHASLVHFGGFGGLAGLFGPAGLFDLADLIRFFSFAGIIVSKTTCRHISRQLIPRTP